MFRSSSVVGAVVEGTAGTAGEERVRNLQVSSNEFLSVSSRSSVIFCLSVCHKVIAYCPNLSLFPCLVFHNSLHPFHSLVVKPHILFVH